MKKVILIALIIIGIGWFFRYSLDRIIIGPFAKSSREEALVDAFLQTCISALGDAQQIELMAESKIESGDWKSYEEEATKLHMTPGGTTLGEWGLPNNMTLITSREVFHFGKANTCVLAMSDARSFFALPAFLSKFHLGSPNWGGAVTADTSSNVNERTWLVTTEGKEVRLAFDVVSNTNAPAILMLAVPQ